MFIIYFSGLCNEMWANDDRGRGNDSETISNRNSITRKPTELDKRCRFQTPVDHIFKAFKATEVITFQTSKHQLNFSEGAKGQTRKKRL